MTVANFCDLMSLLPHYSLLHSSNLSVLYYFHILLGHLPFQGYCGRRLWMVPWRCGDCGCCSGGGCRRGDGGGGCGGRGGVAVDDGAVAAVDLVVVVADEEDVVEERRGGTEGAGLAERRAAVHALHTRIDHAQEHLQS